MLGSVRREANYGWFSQERNYLLFGSVRRETIYCLVLSGEKLLIVWFCQERNYIYTFKYLKSP